MSQTEVLNLISEETGKGLDGQWLDCPLDALSVDSLEYLDLICCLESASDKRVEPPSKAGEFSTVGDLVSYFSC